MKGDRVTFSKAFFDLQLLFAQRVVRLSGLPLAQVLLDYTNLLDRHGAVRQGMAAPLLARLSRQTDMDHLARCFPLQALAVEAPVSDFHEFYEGQLGASKFA
jgi:hypothetical protein